MARDFRRLCVFCGSSNDVDLEYLDTAREVGAELARRGIGVVYGGGHVGLMGQVAEGALGLGGEVYGVIPEKLMARELGHERVTELFVVDSMRARKAMMNTMSDGFISLPGGLGTLEELFEVTTLTQLGYQDKPVGVLNVRGYYDPLIAFIHKATDEGFIRPGHSDLIIFDDDLDGLLDRMSRATLS